LRDSSSCRVCSASCWTRGSSSGRPR
jgi:hypothetical protein